MQRQIQRRWAQGRVQDLVRRHAPPPQKKVNGQFQLQKKTLKSLRLTHIGGKIIGGVP